MPQWFAPEPVTASGQRRASSITILHPKRIWDTASLCEILNNLRHVPMIVAVCDAPAPNGHTGRSDEMIHAGFFPRMVAAGRVRITVFQ